MNGINNIAVMHYNYAGLHTNSIKQNKKNYSDNLIKDTFIRVNQPNFNGNREVTKLLKNNNYQKISSDLVKDDYWSNGIDFIGFNKTNKRLDSTSVGIFNFEQGKTNIYRLTLEKFLESMEKVRDFKKKTIPEEKSELEKSYQSLKKYIEKNK